MNWLDFEVKKSKVKVTARQYALSGGGIPLDSLTLTLFINHVLLFMR